MTLLRTARRLAGCPGLLRIVKAPETRTEALVGSQEAREAHLRSPFADRYHRLSSGATFSIFVFKVIIFSPVSARPEGLRNALRSRSEKAAGAHVMSRSLASAASRVALDAGSLEYQMLRMYSRAR
jgi:hypothetical protein